MRAIGIRELKAHLSRVLRDVATGEAYLVTDRGRVIAELRRPGAEDPSSTDEDRALSRLASAGVLRLAERPKRAYKPSPIKSKAPGLAKALLDADRGE
jgi:antitoxin (DNA-binding transcriptional repressor) of toxin-antitoxin stability system